MRREDLAPLASLTREGDGEGAKGAPSKKAGRDGAPREGGREEAKDWREEGRDEKCEEGREEGREGGPGKNCGAVGVMNVGVSETVSWWFQSHGLGLMLRSVFKSDTPFTASCFLGANP